MRILRLARKIPPCLGGQEYHVRDLSRVQVMRGHRVELVYGLGSEHSRPGLETRRLPGSDTLRHIGRDCFQAIAFLLLACFNARVRRDCDLVHVHGDLFEIAAGRMIADRLGIPLVATVHAGLSRKRWYRLMARTVFPRIDFLIGVSPDIVDEAVALGMDRRRTAWIHSGIFVARFRRRMPPRTDADGPLRIANTGRLHRMKGLHVLIEALAIIGSRRDMELHLIGEGPLRGELERLAREHGVMVVFHGRLDKDAVADELATCDMFVSSSLDLADHREGTPTVVMEAMASGLPVVATDVGGSRHLLGSTGTIVPAGDPHYLASAIESLAADPDRRNREGARNRKSADRFDWRRIADHVDACYSAAGAGR